MRNHKDHICIENKLFCDCPICGEYMQTSTKPAIFLCCGHGIHESCLDEYLKVGLRPRDEIQTNYVCPICQKTIIDTKDYFALLDRWVETHPMPEEYKDWTRTIYCNDCEQTNVVPFNFLYHKVQIKESIYLQCPNPKCNSYNTKVIQSQKRDERRCLFVEIYYYSQIRMCVFERMALHT